MRYETKILILISIVFIFSLTMINFINLYYLNEVIDKYQYVNYLLEKQGYGYLSEPNLNIKDIKKDYGKSLLIWEAFLVFSSILIVYKITERYLEKEKRYKQFLQLLLLSVSHKLGNKTTSLNINIEILKNKCNNPTTEKIEKLVKTINYDLKNLIETFKKFQFERKNEERFFIDELILNNLKEFEFSNKKLFLRLSKLEVYKIKSDIDIILNIAIENAFKYSKNKVMIKIFKKMLIIKNDIKKDLESGSGIGLIILEEVAKLNDIKVIKKVKGKYFTIYLCLS